MIVENHAFAPFVPPRVAIRSAAEPWEIEAARRLRRAVFCVEQRIFADDDRDEVDAQAETIVALTYGLGLADGDVIGTVRIHEPQPRRWHGSRLAIAAAYRSVYGIGAALVHRAVATAVAAGCDEFTAMVQPQNVTFFRRLQWSVTGETSLHGLPHAAMRADLAAYQPLDARAATLLRPVRAS
jgi:putative N-acetyltransferase (TIGR04045 family)